MAKDSLGWIKLYRKIQDSDSYFDEPFCRNMAWIDLLLLANHDKTTIRVRGILIFLERGQVGYSLEKLAERWKWSRNKVIGFLKELQNKEMIVRQKNNVNTCITIINYQQYQDYGIPKSTTKGTTKGITEGTAESTLTRSTKNDKEGVLPEIYGSGIVVYDAEHSILENIKEFQEICIKVGKIDFEAAKISLRKYHLFLAEKEQYPKGKKAVIAGFEKWLMNEKNFNNSKPEEKPTLKKEAQLRTLS